MNEIKNIHELKPIVQIGKNGMNESVFEEIKKHLKKRKLIKIKCLTYYLDDLPGDSNKQKMKDLALDLEEKLNAQSKIVGFTITLAQKRE